MMGEGVMVSKVSDHGHLAQLILACGKAEHSGGRNVVKQSCQGRDMVAKGMYPRTQAFQLSPTSYSFHHLPMII